jgi:hypothetical protein
VLVRSGRSARYVGDGPALSRQGSLIKEFIEVAEAFYEVTNRGELANFHGELALTPEMEATMKRRTRLELEILQKFYSGSA